MITKFKHTVLLMPDTLMLYYQCIIMWITPVKSVCYKTKNVAQVKNFNIEHLIFANMYKYKRHVMRRVMICMLHAVFVLNKYYNTKRNHSLKNLSMSSINVVDLLPHRTDRCANRFSCERRGL